MNWENIWALQPMDGQAAGVVGQAGCEDEMSITDKNDCLYRALTQRQGQLILLPKESKDRKRLGKEILEIQIMKRAIKKEIKKANIEATASFERLAMEECKKLLTDDQWQAAMTRAKRANLGLSV